MSVPIIANLAEIKEEVANSGDTVRFADRTDGDVDPMVYAKVVHAIAAADFGADLSEDETLNCLAESLNQEFLLTRTRVEVESLAKTRSALDIARMILQMIE